MMLPAVGQLQETVPSQEHLQGSITESRQLETRLPENSPGPRNFTNHWQPSEGKRNKNSKVEDALGGQACVIHY